MLGVAEQGPGGQQFEAGGQQHQHKPRPHPEAPKRAKQRADERYQQQRARPARQHRQEQRPEQVELLVNGQRPEVPHALAPVLEAVEKQVGSGQHKPAGVLAHGGQRQERAQGQSQKVRRQDAQRPARVENFQPAAPAAGAGHVDLVFPDDARDKVAAEHEERGAPKLADRKRRQRPMREHHSPHGGGPNVVEPRPVSQRDGHLGRRGKPRGSGSQPW